MNNGEIELTQTISQKSVQNIVALTEDLVKTKLMTNSDATNFFK